MQTIKSVERMNSSEAAAKLQTVQSRLKKYNAALETIKAALDIKIGDTVTVKTGRRSPNNPETDTYKEVPMQVLDAAVIDGKHLYKVRAGEGFTAKELIVGISKLVVQLPEEVGNLNVEQLQNRIQSDTAYAEELKARHAAALKEENREMPFNAGVKLGRAETARTVPCQVLAKHTQESGTTTYAVVAEDKLQIVNLGQLVSEKDLEATGTDEAE